MIHSIVSFILLASSAAIISISALPIQYLSYPIVQWNTNIQSRLGARNAVFLSPDDAWLYVTDRDGGLSKLDPANGDYKDRYVPEKSDMEGGSVIYGEEGIAFHEESGGESFLVYWMFEPSRTGPTTRVVAVRHDPDSEKLGILWTKSLRGTISGMPVIGSEGNFIYFTMNAPAGSVLIAPPPTMDPISATTVANDSPVVSGSPTVSPVASAAAGSLITASPVVNASSTVPPSANNSLSNWIDSVEPLSNGTGEATKLAYFWVDDKGDGPRCVANSDYPIQFLNETIKEFVLFDDLAGCCVANLAACIPNRRLQASQGQSGKFIILSHPLDGTLIYEYDSRDELSIQKHDFAPVGIARRPQYGNYNGGADNTHDVLMWGSGPGEDPRSGETMLFQLPSDFSFLTPDDTSGFRPRVMESVSWTTRTRPTFSESGLDVYFAMSGNGFTGWNKGQPFDIVANFGPIRLPPGTDGRDSGAFRPIVLANDDEMLLIGSTDHSSLFATEYEAGGILWNLGNLGSSRLTTPRLSRDGDIAYFGKANILHAINLTDESLPWGENGFVHPSNAPSDAPTVADFSLSSEGDYLYYCAELIPTSAPTLTPSFVPSVLPTSTPSNLPSRTSSSSPSVSVVPSMSVGPTHSSEPTFDPAFILPSASPTLTLLPSASPTSTLRPSVSPSFSPSDNPSFTPTITLPPSDPPLATIVKDSPTLAPTTSPVATKEEWRSQAPSSIPSDPPPTGNTLFDPWDNPPSATPPSNANPPSAAAELPDDTKEGESSSSLNTTAIIGIAVGGGVGLILIAGVICYALKKKSNGGDGVDREWEASNQTRNNMNAAGGQEGGTTFQYSDEEGAAGQSNQRWGGEGELRW
mmetsp:Transcript_18486/g.44502  ORF Transcript_18486/g.44502 Transcript_18486/m.44502 type:complete len:864 (-) Transcript_18486:711-3302(-)|eukprot:CAMPEP_0181117754 /NCGR_PEP_ID=MMETSP1071-20121207/22702_1 /TAXON_ID=35127 /ORGANISM="Thalassiosira sp., Strain NH16" /LENGTH=863 /DNA_ID=CAMNT_0023202185 /DNA_START=159 /DNA_END=2750 /DNA_ORIENTATION=-